MIQAFEYSLTLGTGERIDISEFDSEATPEVMALPADVVRSCAVMSREDVESAKRGWDVPMRAALRDSVSGLLRIIRPECVHARDCAMWSRPDCTARGAAERRRLPICWEYSPSDSLPAQTAVLVSAIVHAWAAKRRVILTVPHPELLKAPG